MSGVLDDLERLSALFEKGLITREQFDGQRDALMAGRDAEAALAQQNENAEMELLEAERLMELGHIEIDEGSNVEAALR